ncbi:MAG: ABC transporter permease [Bacteroidales bacterium]|nr:MAG: ABC transporter permease [Bacteroidales bacterium]
MIINILKHSLRALNRQKGYVLINIIGLSIGIACSLVITLFIAHELSYDQFNEKKDRIFQLVLNGKIGGQEMNTNSTCAPIGPTMLKEFPEVENIARMNIWGETIIKNNEQSFTENAFIEADSTFFNIFTVTLISGDMRTALNAPHKLVLSKTAASKVFGKENPIGKALKVGTDSVFYTVSGVMEDLPKTSHFDANMIGSFVTNDRANDSQWTSNSFGTYILLKPNSDPKVVDAKIIELIKKYVGAEIQKYLGITLEDFFSKGNKYRMYLQPLTAIHLNPEVGQESKAPNDPKYLIIFGSIAFLIIIIASINFMNLSTAQASRRAKEVGIKKVSGSSRGMLIWQFISESIILTFVSLIVAVIIIKLSLPFFNNLLHANLELNFFDSWVSIPSLILLSIFVGLLAGSYPAFYLSSFSPYAVLKGTLRNSMKNGKLRSVLVILQFTISIILIIGSTIMFHQINYMVNKDLGFNKEQLVVIRRAEVIGNKVNAFKEAIMKIPGVVNVAASTAVPGHSNNHNGYMMEGRGGETYLLQTAWVDYDFFETYGMKINSGRNFDEAHTTDKDVCLINERAVKQFSITSPLTTRIINPSDDPSKPDFLPIIGVINDFHFESLRSEISPYIFKFKNKGSNWGYISIRVSSGSSGGVLKEIEKVWKEFTSNDPMQYFFMDNDFDRLYTEEKQSANLSVLFTFLAILIASLGLFGLTSFTVEQRTKEMGVRKAMGATVSSLFILISREIILLVCISTLIAWPIVYFISKNWLQNYHYRISLPLFDFLLGFIIAIIIAIITISYRTIKSAMLNPSESLRYE